MADPDPEPMTFLPVGAWVMMRPERWRRFSIYDRRLASPYGRVGAVGHSHLEERRVFFRLAPGQRQDSNDPPGLDSYYIPVTDLCPATLPDEEALAWLLLELGGSDAYES